MFDVKRELERAAKYEFMIDAKYNEVLKWYQATNCIHIKQDQEKLLLLAELGEKINQAEIHWLKVHNQEIVFDREFKDIGFAFVDVLSIFYKGKELCEKLFFGDGEADEFIDLICN